jgi:hypothetical protein
MKYLYRAYCRSCCRASCDPRVIGLAVLLVAASLFITSSVAGNVRKHAGEIRHVLVVAAAVILAATACWLLAWAARTVMAATGQHTETVPLRAPQAEPVPVPAPPATARPGQYTWTIRPAEAAAMAAEADSLRDEPEVVTVCELTGADEG